MQSIDREGRFDTSTNDSDVRQDRICWVRESDGTAQGGSGGKGFSKLGDGLLHCVKVLRSIPHALEEHGYSVRDESRERRPPFIAPTNTVWRGDPWRLCMPDIIMCGDAAPPQASHEHRVPKQLQLSCYAGDRRCEYVEHLDHCDGTLSELGVLEWLRTSDYRSRCITTILYLNTKEWGDTPPTGALEDGGQLRIFHKGTDTEDERREEASGLEAAAASGLEAAAASGSEAASASGAAAAASGSEAASASGSEAAAVATARPPESDVPVSGVDDEQESRSFTDVVPKGGTLVVFDSRRMRHQVLPSTQQRLALTCWVTGTSSEQGVDGGAEGTAEEAVGRRRSSSSSSSSSSRSRAV